MKKVLIVGHGFLPLQCAIDKVLAKEIPVSLIPEKIKEMEENEYFKNEALKLKCFNEPNPIQEKIFDKPKSKYHK